MSRSRLLLLSRGLPALLVLVALPAAAQTFMVQCPTSTLLHPNAPTSASGEPPYTGPTTATVVGGVPYVSNGGAVKCQQISGGDGYMTEGDGNQTFMFSCRPVERPAEDQERSAGDRLPGRIRQPYCEGGGYLNGQPNPYSGHCSPNGAVGFVPPAAFRAANVSAVVGQINSTTCTVAPGETCPVHGFIVNDPGAGYSTAPGVMISGGGGNRGDRNRGDRQRLDHRNRGHQWRFRLYGSADGDDHAEGTGQPDRADRRGRDHEHRRDERQPPGAADGVRRGRRILPDADQRRDDHAAGPVRNAHGPLSRLPERFPPRSTTACRMRRWRSTSAPASPITTWRRMREPTSGTATSRRPSTSRWGWWGSCTCGRARTACRSAPTPTWH